MVDQRHAWRFDTLGRLDGLKLHEEPAPKPGANEALIKVRAVSLNVRDTMIAEGRYAVPGRAGVIALSDGAGEIVEVGAHVTGLKPGDRVTGVYFPSWREGRLNFMTGADQFGCTRDGWAADYVVLPAEALVRLPDHLAFAEGATLTCAGLTAWSALTSLPRAIQPGDRVLTMGSGGVALFALQFAKAMGAEVIALTSSGAKAERLRQLGADHVVDYVAEPEWQGAVRKLTAGAGVDHIVESGGVKTFERSLKSVAADGQIASVGVMGGGAPTIDAALLGMAYATIRRIFVGNRPQLEAMMRAMTVNHIRPVIDRVARFDALGAEFRAFESTPHFGKVVVALD
jgi:NADPH:quinone reductase-like Zn-dependent oxidoreductase